MKIVMKLAAPILAISFLSGCSPSTMTKQDSRPFANGFKTEVETYDTISDKNIKLTFDMNLEAVDARFPWNEYQEGVVAKIREKGVTLSESGTPVTIKLEKFKLLGSSHQSMGAAPMTGSIISGLGGGVAGRIVGDAVERSQKPKDDGRNFVPVMDVLIIKDDGSYRNLIQMTATGAVANYNWLSKRASIQATSEIFK